MHNTLLRSNSNYSNKKSYYFNKYLVRHNLSKLLSLEDHLYLYLIKQQDKSGMIKWFKIKISNLPKQFNKLDTIVFNNLDNYNHTVKILNNLITGHYKL